MSMLADPKKKKRYNLVPRGKALYTDENRFGTKMLKKMGWSEGNGLGANADGSTEFVRVRYKNDIEGLGYESRDDQWTQHESEFSGLLKKLNEENGSGSGSEGEGARAVGFGFQTENTGKEKGKLKDKVSGESLEEKSKQSRARVHYKKFTRGKDLSRYSEKELANIFGKKVIETGDGETVVHTNEAKEEESTAVADKEVPENFAGVQTFSSTLSVSDYFKQKMQALKNRFWKSPDSPSKNDLPVNVPEEVETINDSTISNEVEQTKTVKKKKDKKRRAEVTEVASESDKDNEQLANQGLEPEVVQETVSEIKLKKKKHLEEVREEIAAAISEADNDVVMKKKKKKLKKEGKEKDVDTSSNEEDRSARKRKRQNSASIKELASASGDEKDIDTSELKENLNDDPVDPSCSSLNLDTIREKYNETKKYTISKFAAEKFSNFDFDGFEGSNLRAIDGYGIDSSTELNIVESKTDEARIRNFWDETLDKYKDATPRYEYNKFAKKARAAFQTKARAPKFNVKSLKRKNAFLD